MIALSDLKPPNPVVPTSESVRVGEILENIRRYNGETLQPTSDTDRQKPVNWYRRIAQAFPEILFGERPIVTVDTNPELEAWINRHLIYNFTRALRFANINAMRSGTGVVASGLTDGGLFRVVETQHYFPLYDETGETVIADVIIRPYKRKPNDAGIVVIEIYPREEGPGRRYIYKMSGNDFVGPAVQSQEVLSPMQRVFTLINGYPSGGFGESLYLDVDAIIPELGKKLGNLGYNIEQNSEPHLSGPEGAIPLKAPTDSNPDVEYDLPQDRAIYIPVRAGEPPPKFLQWDTEHLAVEYYYERIEELIFAFTGLTRSLFDPNAMAGNVTGNALRRLLIPFVSRLSSLREDNEKIFLEMLNFHNSQGPQFEYEDEDVEIEWPFMAILGDDEDSDGGEGIGNE